MEWVWSPEASLDVEYCAEDAVVTFHRTFSRGTAVAVSSRPLEKQRVHYFEVEVTSELFGTDVMVGVGSEGAEPLASRHAFSSFLGRDDQSYGFSYKGAVQHAGQRRRFLRPFDKGDVVGVLVDLWEGTLTFCLDRQPAVVAFRGLCRHAKLFPMLCSTQSQSTMRFRYASSLAKDLRLSAALSLPQSQYHLCPPPIQAFLRDTFWIHLFKCADEEDDPSDAPNMKMPFFKHNEKRSICPTDNCDLWQVALEPTCNDLQKRISFKSRMTPVLCETCKKYNAVVNIGDSSICISCFNRL